MPRLRTRRLLYETIGTFVLSLSGALLLSPRGLPPNAIAPSLTAALAGDVAGVPASVVAFALVVGGLTFLLGRRSGAHLNPAVSIGLAAAGRFPAADAKAYVAAQLCGGLAAGIVVWSLVPSPHGNAATLMMPAFGAYVIEWIASFALGLMLAMVAADSRVSRLWSAATVGAAVALMSTLSFPYGGVLNSARALLLAPSVSPARLLLVYGVGPITAFAAAFYVYDVLRGSLASHAVPRGVPLGLAGPIPLIASESLSNSDENSHRS